jgi:hypothetical protein
MHIKWCRLDQQVLIGARLVIIELNNKIEDGEQLHKSSHQYQYSLQATEEDETFCMHKIHRACNIREFTFNFNPSIKHPFDWANNLDSSVPSAEKMLWM